MEKLSTYNIFLPNGGVYGTDSEILILHDPQPQELPGSMNNHLISSGLYLTEDPLHVEIISRFFFCGPMPISICSTHEADLIPEVPAARHYSRFYLLESLL